MPESELTLALSSVLPLTDEEKEDAAFRVRDRLWAAIADLFDRYREEQSLSYAALGRRIDRKRGQVHRWLDAPVNMTLTSAGLLAEGLDADIDIRLMPRGRNWARNHAHPSDEARAQVLYRVTRKSQPEEAAAHEVPKRRVPPPGAVRQVKYAP